MDVVSTWIGLTTSAVVVNLTADGERRTCLVRQERTCTSRRGHCRRSGSTDGFTSIIGLTDEYRQNVGEILMKSLNDRPVAALASICKSRQMSCASSAGALTGGRMRVYYLRDLGCDTTIISLGADGAVDLQGFVSAPRASMSSIPPGRAMLCPAACFVHPFTRKFSRIMPAGWKYKCQCLRRYGGDKGSKPLTVYDQLNTFLSSHSLAQKP